MTRTLCAAIGCLRPSVALSQPMTHGFEGFQVVATPIEEGVLQKNRTNYSQSYEPLLKSS